jgi:hypothetical protein
MRSCWIACSCCGPRSGVANEELNGLSWQGDGLSGLVAEGLDRDQACWICRVVEEVAGALDPETLGLKDGGS